MGRDKRRDEPQEKDSELEARLLEQFDRLSPGELEARGFDAARVARIRAAIRDGLFRVDPQAVADAMVRDALDRLARKR